jgi:NAD(P)-dependent dehydrogenase (short-subunit alcohol dehydrogenase family)
MGYFAGKVSLVTGGGGGIGGGLATALAAEGSRVVVADIIAENAAKVVEQIKKAGGNAISVACDVSDRASVQEMKAEANKAFGRVSLLFANAGATSFEPLAEMADQDVDWMIQVNLMGVINCLRTFLPDMIAAREGHVVGTASMAGFLPSWIPVHSPYSAAKMGVIGMMLNLRCELEDFGIGATVYCPGGVLANMKDNNARTRPKQFGGPLNEELKWPEKSFANISLKFNTPEYVAPMVLQAVRDNRPFVFDRSSLRKEFMETYVAPALAAFDAAAAYEASTGKA